METRRYPEKIIVDVKARLHLEHTDKDPKEHRIVEVNGTIESFPNDGRYNVTLRPQNEIRFSQITSGPCVILVIVFILDWPKPANSRIKKIRDERGLPAPQNFLDLSDGEYSATVRLNFEDGYAFKRCDMKKIGENHYEAHVETVHRYPSSKSLDIIRILPHDITITDGGPGKLIGSTQVRWLRKDNTILTGDVQMGVQLKNPFRRICFPEVFSYEYDHTPFDVYPFEIKARGEMRLVDTTPEPVEFDEQKKVYKKD
jgi:hypothetical protein